MITQMLRVVTPNQNLTSTATSDRHFVNLDAQATKAVRHGHEHGKDTTMVPASQSNGVFLFNVGTIGLSRCGGRKPSTLMHAARHNRREIQAELGAHSHIDVKRICLNETIAGPDTSEAVVALAMKLKSDAGVGKLRRDHAQAIELLFSLAQSTTINIRDYFLRCVVWAGDRFGSSNVLSADIHRDESAPHCHVLILPLVDGKMRGSELISKEPLVNLRKSFASEVAHEFGLKEPAGRMNSAMREEAVRMVLQQLESTHDPMLTSPLWQTVKRDIERDPARFLGPLGIEVKQVVDKRKKRTMAQIFTSPGKGSKVDKTLNPIGFVDCTDLVDVSNPEIRKSKPIEIANCAELRLYDHRTLSCVGFAQEITSATPKSAPCDTGSDVRKVLEVVSTYSDDDGEDF